MNANKNEYTRIFLKRSKADHKDTEEKERSQRVKNLAEKTRFLIRACFKNASAAQIAPGLKPEDGWEEAIFAGSKEPRSTD